MTTATPNQPPTKLERLRELLSTFDFYWGYDYNSAAKEKAGREAAREIRELGAQLVFQAKCRDAVVALWEEFKPKVELGDEDWPLRFGNVMRAKDLPNEGVWFKKNHRSTAYCRVRTEAARFHFHGMDESKVYGFDTEGGMTAVDGDKWVVMCQMAVIDPDASLAEAARAVPRPRNDFDPFCGFDPAHYDDPDFTNPK